jgi:hypothetical protein
MEDVENNPFLLTAVVSKVMTTADGGIKVTLDISSDADNKIHFSKLLELATDPQVVAVVIRKVNEELY